MPRAGRANKAAHELQQDAVFVRAPRCPSCLRGRAPGEKFWRALK